VSTVGNGRGSDPSAAGRKTDRRPTKNPTPPADIASTSAIKRRLPTGFMSRINRVFPNKPQFWPVAEVFNLRSLNVAQVLASATGGGLIHWIGGCQPPPRWVPHCDGGAVDFESGESDWRYATRSRTSCSLSASSRPSGIQEYGCVSIFAMSARSSTRSSTTD
jgi:hypothetical protein